MQTVCSYTPYSTYSIYGVHVFEELFFQINPQYNKTKNIIYCYKGKVFLQTQTVYNSGREENDKETKTIPQVIEEINKYKDWKKESKHKYIIEDYSKAIEFYDEILHKMRDYQLDIFIEPDKKRSTDYDYLAMAC
jgi:hypothetical protein